MIAIAFKSGERVEIRRGPGSYRFVATGGGTIVGSFVIQEGNTTTPAKRVELVADGRDAALLVVPPPLPAQTITIEDSIALPIGKTAKPLFADGPIVAVAQPTPNTNRRTELVTPPTPTGILRFVATFDGTLEVSS